MKTVNATSNAFTSNTMQLVREVKLTTNFGISEPLIIRTTFASQPTMKIASSLIAEVLSNHCTTADNYLRSTYLWQIGFQLPPITISAYLRPLTHSLLDTFSLIHLDCTCVAIL